MRVWPSRRWEAKSGRAIGEPLRGHQGFVWSAAYSADGSRIVSAGQDGTVQQWETLLWTVKCLVPIG
ncbi:MAG: WD40 repeat domain-containing protein [Cyanobium sp.]